MRYNPDDILPKMLGRDGSFLQQEMNLKDADISSQLKNAKVLVIGAAGSIGASFVRVLTGYAVKSLHLIDISESNLAELVRDFRSAGVVLPDDFKTYAIDFSGPEMAALLDAQQYDYVLNFAALKHVRSERDPFTMMRLLEVNVLANDNLCQQLMQKADTQMVFSVSSDKSVRPASIMGASKAFMERVFLANCDKLPFTSARFANVAFSDGSLLHSFCQRLEKNQPLSAPSDVRRYFISHREAGELCFLGCFAGLNKEIVFPQLDQTKDMMTFSEIAKLFLNHHGYEALECESDVEARAKSLELTTQSTQWPCHFSESDTSGEKMYEEFSDTTEVVNTTRYPNLGIVTDPTFHGSERVYEGIASINNLRAKGAWEQQELIDIVSKAVPELTHVSSSKNLDQKM